MNTKFKKLLLFILGFVVMSYNSKTVFANGRELSAQQWHTADTIAQIAIDNWEEYGVLPSVAVAQAFIESTLGERCPNYNLWGIKSGAVYYPSLYEGTMGYLRVINNGYYKGAPFKRSYEDQIRIILNGGYCVGDPCYYDNAIWSIEYYQFYKYDQLLAKKLEEKERREKERKDAERRKQWKKAYTVVYKANVASNAVLISNKLVKQGSVCLYDTKGHHTMQGIFDVRSNKKINKTKKRLIYTSNKNIAGSKVWLEVREEAKG